MKFKQFLTESNSESDSTYYVLIFDDFTEPARPGHVMCRGIVWFSSDEERKHALIYREFGSEDNVQILYDDYALKIKHFTEMTTQEFITEILSKKKKYKEFMDSPNIPGKTHSYTVIDVKQGFL